MGFFEWFSYGPQSLKQSESRTALAIAQLGQAQTSPKNYESFSKEGYQANVIAFKCIQLIVAACKGVNWELYRDRVGGKPQEITDHEILKLLTRPNPMQSWASFVESVIAYYCISGNSFVEATGLDTNKIPLELWPMRPDMTRIVPGKMGIPEAYVFKTGQKEVVFNVDQIKGKSPILHLKTFHPTNNWYGMSPLEAAMYSIDQHNESSKWNLNLLANAATPSGAFTVTASDVNPGATLPHEIKEELRAQINEKVTGSRNAGKLLLLDGGLDWKQMGFNPKDMDWLEGRQEASRDIARAYGVPPILLNIPGDSTFNNQREARLAFYEDTIFPLLDHLAQEFNHWLIRGIDPTLRLTYNRDAIPAIAEKRAEQFKSYETINYLTINEKRQQMGFEATQGGDVIYMSGTMVPLGYVPAQPEETPPPPEPKPDDNEKALVISENPLEIKQINVTDNRGRLKTWLEINEMRRKMTFAFSSDLQDFLSSEAKQVAEAVANSGDPRIAEFAALSAMEKMRPELQSILQKHIGRAAYQFGLPVVTSGKHLSSTFETKGIVQWQDFVKQFAVRRSKAAEQLVESTSEKRVVRKIRDAVSEGLAEGLTLKEVAKNLESELEGLSSSRAMTIARTEISIASNQGGLEAAKALQIPNLKKTWISAQDERTRPWEDSPELANHRVMNGKQVGLDENFDVPPDSSMNGPGDPSAPADQVINCRCVLIYGTDRLNG